MSAPVRAGTISLAIGNQTVKAEIAATEEQRELGLMHRKQLCKNCGMLFVFKQPGYPVFWMKDAPLPLALAFIAADGSILEIIEMQPNTSNGHYPESPALFALEMNKEWFTRNGIHPGAKINGLQLAPSGQ